MALRDPTSTSPPSKNESADVVRGKGSVDGYDRHLLRLRLRDQHPIERIPMVHGKHCDGIDVRDVDLKQIETLSTQ